VVVNLLGQLYNRTYQLKEWDMAEIGVTLQIFTDTDWHMEVSVFGDDLSVAYIEHDTKYTNRLNFSSREEMRAVARAMLSACDTYEKNLELR
jgi:hypothetical protein